MDELAREDRGVGGLLAGQGVREHLVAAGADEDRRDDVGLHMLVEPPELLLGGDVGLGGPEDGDGAGLPLTQALLEAREDAPVAHERVEDRLVVEQELEQLLDPGHEICLDRVLAGPRGQLEQLREVRLALDDDRDDEVDLVLEVDVDGALRASGRARDLPRRRTGNALLADERVGRLDDPAAQRWLDLDCFHHE